MEDDGEMEGDSRKGIVEITVIKSIKDLPPEENLLPGTPACSGCGGLLALRHCLKALGERTVIANAVCYDNEAYGNTGFQWSGATPPGSKTGTTPAGKTTPTGAELPKKDLFEIWRSHKPPYLATISPAHPVDIVNKFRRAEGFKGPRLFIALSPCPPGWAVDPSHSARLAKLAVDTGIWALKEAVYGDVRHTVIPKMFKPVEDYLKEQGRFSHLFKPVRQEGAIKRIQGMVDDYWKGESTNPLSPSL